MTRFGRIAGVTETGSQVCRSSITTPYLKEDKRTLKISGCGKSPVLPHFGLPAASKCAMVELRFSKNIFQVFVLYVPLKSNQV